MYVVFIFVDNKVAVAMVEIPTTKLHDFFISEITMAQFRINIENQK
jgi:hypothetical protein